MNADNNQEVISHDRLKELRLGIDNIDAAIIYMLAERFRYTNQVGILKARLRLPAADPVREKEQIARLMQLAQSAQMDQDFAATFLHFIISEVVRRHEKAQMPPGSVDIPLTGQS